MRSTHSLTLILACTLLGVFGREAQGQAPVKPDLQIDHIRVALDGKLYVQIS